jgi:RNA polymerase sigma factor (TIGR02999 family)
MMLMQDVSQLLNAANDGDKHAAGALLPLVYDELRKIAVARMAMETSQQTLQPTALVHEAYLKLIGPMDEVRWANQAHFFAAAAEAMRHILVDAARRKAAVKHGGDRARVELVADLVAEDEIEEDLVALDEALTRLAVMDAMKAELVKLRYFAGLTLAEAAATLGISERTAGRQWAFARAWLRREVEGTSAKS